jgi:hypothetical protein
MRLFKYVNAERVDIIENQQIRFTSPKDFNDALDTRPRVAPLKNRTALKIRAKSYEAEILRSLPLHFHLLPRAERRKKEKELFRGSIKYMQENAEAIAKKIEGDVYLGISQLFGVLCLTASFNNRLMWGNYADGDRGFMIEFDSGEPRFGPGVIHKIVYSEEPPTYDPAIGSDGWWKVKSLDWEYENEYRIVSLLNQCEKKLVNGKTIYLKHLPRQCIKSIFMGLAMENKIKEKLRDISKPAGIKLFEAVISYGKSQYEFREI